MFFFGDNSLAIDHYFLAGRELAGGRLLDIHYEEMDENQLRVALTCLGYSLKLATQDGASDELLAVLEKPYREVFSLLCGVSLQFRKDAANRVGKQRSEEYVEIALSAD